MTVTLHADDYWRWHKELPLDVEAFTLWLERTIGRSLSKNEGPRILAVTLGEGFVICDEARSDESGDFVVVDDCVATDPVTYRSDQPPPWWPGLPSRFDPAPCSPVEGDR